MKNKKLIKIISISLVCIILAFAAAMLGDTKKINIPELLGQPSSDMLEMAIDKNYYGNYLYKVTQGGAQDYTGKDITANFDTSIPQNSGKELILAEYEGRNNVVLSSEIGSLEYMFSIPEDGLYNISVDYICKSGSIITPERQLLIDGKLPFEEAFYLSFPRSWTELDEKRLDSNGDQIRNSQKEQYIYQKTVISDSTGFYIAPFKFYYTKGEHSLSLVGKDCDIVISSISLLAPEKIISYELYADQYSKNEKSIATGKKYESEFVLSKSSSSIRSEWTNDPIASPRAITNITYNTFGGSNWQNGNESATWGFDVEKEGMYSIAFRYAVPKSGFVSYRQIKIDNKIPFMELSEYPFTSNKWSAEKLISKEGEPFLFHLDAGSHTISLNAVVGPLRQVVYKLKTVQTMLDLLFQQINLVTATIKDSSGKIKSDLNRDYNLDKKIPNLTSDLQFAAKTLDQCNQEILTISQGNKQQITSSLMLAIDTFEKMALDPELVPRQLNEFSNIMISLGTSVTALLQEPLYLDYMLIGGEDMSIPKYRANEFDSAYATVESLFNSFKPETTEMKESDTLSVWVARGRDWVQLINQLANDDFTQKMGIKVNLNTMPLMSDYMIITAYSGGKVPDIALGMGGTTPVEFAARGAVADLTQFDGYEKTISQLVKNSTDCYKYGAGVYALPETADFQVLFYRTDIMKQLNLKVPETFDDIYKMLPILQENGMQFYYPSGPGGFTPFLFQSGSNYYTENMRKSGVDSVASIAAFEEYTNLFNKYKLPLQADFFQRMRFGEMPIGIGSYDLYSKLLTSAPELSGKWSMALFPGHRKSDGTIDRTAPAGSSAAIILNSSKNKTNAWKFLSWWMSEETQTRYGQEVQYLLGAGSQWNTANVQAIGKLGFKKQYLDVIMEQWSFFKPIPIVPGSYYTDRQFLNAWTRNVISGESSRIVLEDAVKEINKELERKQAEFDKRRQP